MKNKTESAPTRSNSESAADKLIIEQRTINLTSAENKTTSRTKKLKSNDRPYSLELNEELQKFDIDDNIDYTLEKDHDYS